MVLQWNRTNRSLAIGSCDCGSQEVPQSAESWRTRKAGGLVQSKSKGLRTRGADGVSSNWGPKAQGSEGQLCKSLRFEGPRTRSWSPSLKVQVWRSKNQEHRCPRAEKKMDVPAQRINLPFCLFVLFRLSTDWMMPTYNGERNLLHSVYGFKC